MNYNIECEGDPQKGLPKNLYLCLEEVQRFNEYECLIVVKAQGKNMG